MNALYIIILFAITAAAFLIFIVRYVDAQPPSKATKYTGPKTKISYRGKPIEVAPQSARTILWANSQYPEHVKLTDAQLWALEYALNTRRKIREAPSLEELDRIYNDHYPISSRRRGNNTGNGHADSNPPPAAAH